LSSFVSKIIKWSLGIIVVALFAVVYKTIDPAKFIYFPKCPFYELTGYKCPGCGSQRAIHHLLNAEFGQAFKENMLLVISIPYLITGIAFDLISNPGERILKWRKALFGKKAIYIILTVIIAFWILRNLPYFQHIM
jgi:Protein of unknown function (DUF2752)